MPDNEHSTEQIPPVLPAQLPRPLVRMRAKQRMVQEGWEDMAEEYHLLFGFAKGSKTP